MSATEIPVLDPKNIIARGYGPGTEHAGSHGKSIYDPVAKLRLVVSRYHPDSRFNYGSRECRVEYIPDMTPEIFDEPMTQAQWDQLYAFGVDGQTVKVASRIIGVTVKGKHYLYVVELGNFAGIGAPNEDMLIDRGHIRWHNGDMKYKFWPDGVTNKNKIAAPYYLHMMFNHITTNLHGRDVDRMGVSHCGIAVDQALADFMGLEMFPDAERIDEHLVMVLKGDARRAG